MFASKRCAEMRTASYSLSGVKKVNKNKAKIRIKQISLGLSAVAALALAMQVSAQELELAVEQPTAAGSVASANDDQPKAGRAQGETAVYIVRLNDPAVATYEGGIQDLAATSIRVTGERWLNANPPRGPERGAAYV